MIATQEQQRVVSFPPLQWLESGSTCRAFTAALCVPSIRISPENDPPAALESGTLSASLPHS